MTINRSHLAALVLSLATLSAGAPVVAADVPGKALGDWTLAPSEDGQGCFLTRIYDRPGDTTLLLGLDRDGSNHLTVLNDNWSIKPREKLSLDFRLTSGGYPRHFAVGLEADGKRGFVSSFETAFPTYLAKSQRLDIARGDVPVERLSLDGSGAAIAALRQCVAARKLAPAKTSRMTQAADDIPRDPFAKRGGRDR
ncbi:hypothetical protein SOM26_00350 [Sphingomonas sp. CFBP8993]|uniref:hypothetical protein n=1 Tax=Sphingomonas sp. CFBP8993 TaxID=3096526 RepID=UPI002A6A8854|nr:hypothetical protein [Sphingomonas sp. CFBP8993]MDY0957130.1 hypothetical protein [Sphingomonas sp. CFBP8993]